MNSRSASHEAPTPTTEMIAETRYKIARKRVIITVGCTVLGAALAVGLSIILIPAIPALSSLVFGAAAGLLAANEIANLTTLKDTQTLEIRLHQLEGNIQGNAWWNGYRQKVLDFDQNSIAPPKVNCNSQTHDVCPKR